jgi:RNA polymerase sigma-70 factor (ECF subfamily)
VTAHENSFQSFLKVIATNTAENYFRSSASTKSGAADVQNPNARDADHIIPGRGDDSSNLQRETLLQEIDAILKARLHGSNFERDYAIFWLYYSHGLSAKEISALSNVKLTVKGVESTLFRLTQQIRLALTQRTKNPQ